MSRQNRKAGARRDRTNLYSEITDKIIAELEAGRVPWVQPWGTLAAKAPLGLPKNASTDRQYSGINVLLLWGAVIERGFSGQSWLTFRQALSLGGNVRKGERGTTVVYADRFVPEDEKRRARETGEDATVYARHGTTIDTRLTVVDKIGADDPTAFPASRGIAPDVATLLGWIGADMPPRAPVSLPTISGRPIIPSRSIAAAPRNRGGVSIASSISDPTSEVLTYETVDWTPPQGGHLTDAIYEEYALQSIRIPGSQAHPTRLVQSAAMASVAPPKPDYRPHLPAELVADGTLSDAQLESVIYAGEAHAQHLAGSWTVDETCDVVTAAAEDAADAVRFRRGWFLGDGTGAGKGRQVAGILLDNWPRAVAAPSGCPSPTSCSRTHSATGRRSDRSGFWSHRSRVFARARPPGRNSPATTGSPLAAKRLFSMAQPIVGTLAESYFRKRGIAALHGTGSLRFHPRCYYRPDEHSPTETWPALIASVSDLNGHQTGAHRTWLDPNGFSEATLGKAPIETPRRAMGDLLGQAVRFGVAGEVMAAGEGIETMLSLRCVLPEMPMAAALSAAHLGAILFPDTLRRLYIVRDDDPAGNGARDTLVERADALGIEALPLSPMLGDLNEDLRLRGLDAFRASIRVQLAPQDVSRFVETVLSA